MADYNRVLLMGNLTRDPEIRYGSGGNQSGVCKFGLAVNRKWRDQSGSMREDTCFVDIVVFGRQAETCNQYLNKGRPVFVEGRLSFSSWDDRETGKKRSKLEVVGERVQFLGGRGDDGGGNRDGGYQQAQRPRERAPVASNQGGPSGPPSQGIELDDIPF